MKKLKHEDITYKIRKAIFEVYNVLGPGFKETVYHKSIEEEFNNVGLSFEDERRIDVNGVFQRI